MSAFIKQLIRNKLSQLTSDELLYYAEVYNFSVNRKQAQDIIAYLRRSAADPFDPNERVQMFEELARITDRKTAKEAQRLFQNIATAYGLENLFS